MAEVLPVSSSAQLVLVPWLLRWAPLTGLDRTGLDRTTSAAALHAGSCAGIAFARRRELVALRPGELATFAAVSAPAALAGLLAADRVEARLGRPPQLAALLAGAGALLWWADARGGHARGLGPREAALAAAAQVTALIPGVSRSGATLTALRAAGVERAAAARFTALMALPVTAGAAGLTLVRADRQQVRDALPELAAGVTAAAVVAALTTSVRRADATATLPAAYRLALAAVVARRLWQDRRERAS